MVYALVRTKSGRGAERTLSNAGSLGSVGPAPLSEDDLEIIASLRQGDIVKIDSLPILTCDSVRFHSTPHGAVLLTQTCDAVRREKLTVGLSPIVRLEGDIARNARNGKLLRYVHVPSAGSDVFADMSVIVTVDKARFLAASRTAGIDQTDDDEVRRFGRAVGRRFGRFPFPNEVVPWLRPLEVVVQGRHNKDSPEGAAMRDVVELRVEAVGGWQNPPYALTLCVIVERGVIPSFPTDDEPPCPHDLAVWLRSDNGNLRQTSTAIADRLAAERRGDPSSATVYWLWLSLAEAWAARCTPDLHKYSPEEAAEIQAAVDGIDADVVDESGFDLYRYRRSEQLDLDHLSPPPPI